MRIENGHSKKITQKNDQRTYENPVNGTDKHVKILAQK